MNTIFISDLHLDAAYPEAGRQLDAFLKDEARATAAVYILGDLFEAWIGDDDDDPARSATCAALRSLTNTGVPCFFMHGNRDFLAGNGFAARTGCQLLPDPCVIELHGEPVLLTHGDLLCTEDHSYQQWRATVRQPHWQRRMLRLPLRTRRLIAEAARSGSQQHMARSVPAIMDVTPAAVHSAMRACGVRTLIHGHTHRPQIHEFELDGHRARRVVLGDWYQQGSLLRVSSAGQYTLQALTR